MKRFILILAVILCCSCSKRFYPTSTRDSVRVETRRESRETITERLRSVMLQVPVPRESRERYGATDSSRLETSVAFSAAWIGADGKLNHTLTNKDTSLSADVYVSDTEIERETIRDSTDVNKNSEIIVQKVNELTWWQQAKIKAFWSLLTAWLVHIAYTRLKKYLKLK